MQLPSHVASEITAAAIAVVKLNSKEPATEQEKQTAIDGTASAWDRILAAHGEAGAARFLMVLATLAGQGFYLAGAASGKNPAELVDQLGVNIEIKMIEQREFPDEQ